MPVAYYRRVTYARDERLSLCALLDDAGPDAPTLCAGWTTVDLAAHLVLRERRPDAGLGILGGPLAGHTRRVQAALAATTPFGKLVDAIRSGPPRFSVFGLPGADERLNLAEYFVHHEDARRGTAGWQPRKLDPAFDDVLWQQLAQSRHLLRRAPVGVEFARTGLAEAARHDGRTADAAAGAQPGSAGHVRMTMRARAPVVTVVGTPAELMMWVFGRLSAALVTLEGSDADIRALQQAKRKI